MIDFEVDWTHWFDGIAQPDSRKIEAVLRESRSITRGAEEIGNYFSEEDASIGNSALADFCRDVESIIDDLTDVQAETEARFKEAETGYDQANINLAWFLNHHKAVLVTNTSLKYGPASPRPIEVVSWVDNNCQGDYQTFDVENHVAIVFLDEKDRLHCKLRFG